MGRILVCECKQEISSFNPVLGRYEDFIVTPGPEILAYHRQVRSEMGGALSVFDSVPGVEIAPGYSARAVTSGGTLASEDFGQLASEFLQAVREVRGVDGVYSSLHGALATENEPDVEGYLLAETRKIIGEKIPVAISLDLHGILTDRMIKHSDALSLFHTYPHVDFFETGQRAARLLLELLAGRLHPVRAFFAAGGKGLESLTYSGDTRMKEM